MTKDSDPKGWRIAALVVALALALTASAYAIHVKTFCDPRHPECRKIGPAETHATDSHAGDAHTTDSHGAAPAGAIVPDSHGTTPDTSKAATPGTGKSGH